MVASSSPHFVAANMAVYTARAQAEELARLMTALDWAQPDSHELLLTAAEAASARIADSLKIARTAHEEAKARAA
jgi:hypothetical protein